MGTSIKLFKLPTGKRLQSLCPGPVAWSKWAMVGWKLGSIWFAVLELSVLEILTDPPISAVGKNIWAGCSLPLIQFLVILFPNGVVNDGIGRFLS